MKFTCLLCLLFILSLTSVIPCYSQTFEISNGDTINYTDANGKQQGHWVIYNRMRKRKKMGYTDDQIIEEGKYVNGERQGIWIGYHNNGVVKYEITFKDDFPNGYAKFYYKSGSINEEGYRELNKWVGKYLYYYENGQIAYDFFYDNNGERQGKQLYYHENGNIMVSGNWDSGKESGLLKEYYENGSLKSERTYSDGYYSPSNTKIYKMDEVPAVKPIIKPVDKNAIKQDTNKEEVKLETQPIIKPPTISNTDKSNDNPEFFNGTGDFILKNKEGNVIKEGYFQKGKLINGIAYIYYSNGKLKKTIVYENAIIIEQINHPN